MYTTSSLRLSQYLAITNALPSCALQPIAIAIFSIGPPIKFLQYKAQTGHITSHGPIP